LLDPLTAVRLVWAITGGFPKSRLLKKKEEADLKESDTPPTALTHYSNINADEANILLTKIVTESEKDVPEKEYVTKSVIAMRASLRNLGTIYNGRELNFKENEVLRDAYVESIKASIEFGKNIKDYAIGIPTAVVGALASVGVSLILSDLTGKQLNSTDLYLVAIVFGLLGYLYYWVQIKIGYHANFRDLMQQELERDVYYEQYLYRVHRQLQELFTELNTIHYEVFHNPYSENSETEGREAITNLIKNLCPTACENVCYCSREKGTNTDRWAWCETGIGDSCLTLRGKPPKPEDCPKECPHWKRETNVKYYIIPIAVIVAIVVLAGTYLIFFAAPGPVATLEKTSPFQDLLMNQSMNISVALMNKGSDSITDISIKDEVPEGFNLTTGSTTLTAELLDQGRTIFMNYTLTASKAGKFDLNPAKATYAVNGSPQMISSKPITITVSEKGNTSPS